MSSINMLISYESPRNDVEMTAIGKSAAINHFCAIPGVSNGFKLGQAPVFSVSATGPSSGHHQLFYWADFYAQYNPGIVEVASFGFLEQFLVTCNEWDDTQCTWTYLHPLQKDVIPSMRRKASLPAALCTIGAFVSKTVSPFPDRRIRKEFLTTVSLSITSFGAVARGQVEVRAEELGSTSFFKKKLAIFALRALASALPW